MLKKKPQFTNMKIDIGPRTDLIPLQVLNISPTTSPKSQINSNELFGASEIINGIFLGNIKDSINIKGLINNGITHVLSVLNLDDENTDYKINNIKHKIINIEDGDYPINKYFDDANDFINSALFSGGKILIHCFKGISRSATILLQYLMQYGNDPINKKQIISLNDAFEIIRKHRDASPNMTFYSILQNLDNINQN